MYLKSTDFHPKKYLFLCNKNARKAVIFIFEFLHLFTNQYFCTRFSLRYILQTRIFDVKNLKGQNQNNLRIILPSGL